MTKLEELLEDIKRLGELGAELKERIQELEGQLDDARAHLAVERGKARRIAEQAIAHGAVHQSFENKGGCGTCVYLKHESPHTRCTLFAFHMSEREATAPRPPPGCLYGPAQICFVKPRASAMERCDGAVFAGPMTPGMELERQHAESAGMQPGTETEPECSIIGGMRGWEGGAAFVRVPMLVRRGSERYIKRGRGEELITDEEYRGVLESGEALELPQPWPFRPDRELWLLRKNFPHRESILSRLKRKGALRYLAEGEEGAILVCVDAQKADGLREDVASLQYSRAQLLKKENRLQEALEAAELTVDLMKYPTPAKMALVIILYDHLGEHERADAYLEMVLNSYGEKCHSRVMKWLSGSLRRLPPEQVVVSVAGLSFECGCGSSVFLRQGHRYTCKSCGIVYVGEDPEQQRLPEVARYRTMTCPRCRRPQEAICQPGRDWHFKTHGRWGTGIGPACGPECEGSGETVGADVRLSTIGKEK